jgi:hypothetical protein
MKLPLFLILLFIYVPTALLAGDHIYMEKIAYAELESNFSKEDIETGINQGIWNQKKTAFASSFGNYPKSKVYMFLRIKNKEWKAIDLSFIEDTNLSKLGLASKEDYTKILSQPIKWFEGDYDYFVVLISTQAWKNGQKFTTSEPQIIKQDGTILYR